MFAAEAGLFGIVTSRCAYESGDGRFDGLGKGRPAIDQFDECVSFVDVA
jgi:hypothetical protein